MQPIPSLIFSTQSDRPISGMDFNREVVAESPGIPAEARSLFAHCADIALSASVAEPTIFIFRRVDPESWLFCRALSLRVYRQNSHQLLVHGLILDRQHLSVVEGNPFLLTEIPGLFLHRHPAGHRHLEPFELPKSFDWARQSNARRLDALSRELESSSGFLDHFEALRRSAPTYWSSDRPESQWAEWLLLHFHPEDRVEIPFHTWLVGDGIADYALTGIPRGERVRSAIEIPDSNRTLAKATETFRRSVPAEDFLAWLERYGLTYLSNRLAQPLDEISALAGIRAGLGHRPDNREEQEIREDLEFRGHRDLVRTVQRLVEQWHSQGFEAFQARFERALPRLFHVTLAHHVPADQLSARLRGDPRKTWVALELIRHKALQSIVTPDLLHLWRSGVPPQRFSELLGQFGEGPAVTRVDPALGKLVEISIAHQWSAPGAEQSDLDSLDYWSAWEDWRARLGLPPIQAFALMEELIGQHATHPKEPAKRFRQLAKLALRRDEPFFGYRLVLDRELPALGELSTALYVDRLVELIRELADGEAQDAAKMAAARNLRTLMPLDLLPSEPSITQKLVGATLQRTVYVEEAGEPHEVGELLQSLGNINPRHFASLIGSSPSGDDWIEWLFDQVIRGFRGNGEAWPADEARAWKSLFELCFLTTLQVWKSWLVLDDLRARQQYGGSALEREPGMTSDERLEDLDRRLVLLIQLGVRSRAFDTPWFDQSFNHSSLADLPLEGYPRLDEIRREAELA